MRVTFAMVCAAILWAGAAGVASAQPKKGQTCAQWCQQVCQGKHYNCFDTCSTRRCNR